jgi:hypothetical protein
MNTKHIVTRDGQTIGKRASKTRTYTHAIVQSPRTITKQIAYLESAAARTRKSLAEHEAARTAETREESRPWRMAGADARRISLSRGTVWVGSYVSPGDVPPTTAAIEQELTIQIASLTGRAAGYDADIADLKLQAAAGVTEWSDGWGVLSWHGSRENAEKALRASALFQMNWNYGHEYSIAETTIL